MKTRRYSEAQVFRILKEVESGMPVVNAAREHGVSPATIHRWKSKYGGITIGGRSIPLSAKRLMMALSRLLIEGDAVNQKHQVSGEDPVWIVILGVQSSDK